MWETLEMEVQPLGWEDPLEKEMATHSRILAWRIPWTGEPGRLQSMGLQRVRHDWSDLAHTHLWLLGLKINSETVKGSESPCAVNFLVFIIILLFLLCLTSAGCVTWKIKVTSWESYHMGRVHSSRHWYHQITVRMRQVYSDLPHVQTSEFMVLCLDTGPSLCIALGNDSASVSSPVKWE